MKVVALTAFWNGKGHVEVVAVVEVALVNFASVVFGSELREGRHQRHER